MFPSTLFLLNFGVILYFFGPQWAIFGGWGRVRQLFWDLLMYLNNFYFVYVSFNSVLWFWLNFGVIFEFWGPNGLFFGLGVGFDNFFVIFWIIKLTIVKVKYPGKIWLQPNLQTWFRLWLGRSRIKQKLNSVSVDMSQNFGSIEYSAE